MPRRFAFFFFLIRPAIEPIPDDLLAHTATGARARAGDTPRESKDCHAPKIRSKKVVEVPIVVLTRKMTILAQIKKNRIITFSANAPRSGRSSHTLGPAARAKAQEGYGACLRSPS